MRKADMYRALFTSLYTIYDETPEPDRDPKIWEYIDKYMPNYGRKLPPKDPSLMEKFQKFVDKHHKDAMVDEEEALKTVREFADRYTDFGKVMSGLPLDDWKSLCDLIESSNIVDAVNAMKENGTYESMVRAGQGDKIMDYINDHPDLIENADPGMAMQSMGGMGMGAAASQPEKKKTVHPNQKKKNKNKKKK